MKRGIRGASGRLLATERLLEELRLKELESGSLDVAEELGRMLKGSAVPPTCRFCGYDVEEEQ